MLIKSNYPNADKHIIDEEFGVNLNTEGKKFKFRLWNQLEMRIF